MVYLQGTSKNSNFFVRARKRRTQNRSVYGIHEDSSTALTRLSRKKYIFRGALKIVAHIGLIMLCLVLFGNRPFINELRFSAKVFIGLIDDIGDKQQGLNTFSHRKYLKQLRQNFDQSSSLPSMVTIPPGKLTKGYINEKWNDGSIEYSETNIDAFMMSATEVTVEQWDTCVAFDGCSHLPDNYGWGRGQLPVVNVSWNDVQQYLKWLNQVSDSNYRLPSSAEWEYAAKATSITRFPWGNDLPTCDQVRSGSPSWVKPAGRRCQIKGTWPVGRGQPNAWGLFNIIGNASEWTSDCGATAELVLDGSPISQATDKDNPLECSHRINRGGNWCSAQDITALHSRSYQVDHRYNRVGFRLVQDI